MKGQVVAVLTSAALAFGVSVAIAQDAPNTKIMDGINGAPNYSPMPPAGGGTQATINDGINGAPNYKATTAAAPQPPAKRRTASTKPSSTQQHAHHRKHHHTPAS